MYKLEVFMITVSKIYVGVDISKDNLDICIEPLGKSFRIANSQEAIEKFIKKLPDHEVIKIACESTGGYEKLLDQILSKHDINLWIVDPRRIKGFIVSKNCKSKTDKIDALKIAQFVMQNCEDCKQIKRSEQEQKLRALVDRKQDLTVMLAAEKTRLKHPSHALSIKSIEKIMEYLDNEIKSIDKQIKEQVELNVDLKSKLDLLVSIPGIGQATAAVLLSSLPELGKIGNHQIASLIGVAPYTRESGNFKGKSFVSGGRAIPRKALYMCALTTIKYHLPLKAFYDRLISNKKPFKVAMVAVMRKFIIIANVILRKGEMCK
jgi:transposase